MTTRNKPIIRAAVIAVGDEMLTGRRRNTNAEVIAERLGGRSIVVNRISVIPDEVETIAREIRSAWDEARLVILTGGLGPTADDLTREALARAVERPLVLDQRLLEILRRRFEEFGRVMTPNNESQALVVEGADPLPNAIGTAPGLWVTDATGLKVAAALPGVPWEMEAMLARHLLPRLESFFKLEPIPYACVKLSGVAESHAEMKIREKLNAVQGLRWGIYAGPEGIELRWSCPDGENAEAVLGAGAAVVEEALGAQIYAREDRTLPEVVGERLRDLGETLGVAESCTGGLLGERITSVPGASKYFVGGVLAYANEVKKKILGVDPSLIEEHGAVSEPAARAMAENLRCIMECDHALSITGIAGPSGGTDEKPVGTVFIGYAGKNGVTVERHRHPGDRDLFRRRTVAAALWLLYKNLNARG